MNAVYYFSATGNTRALAETLAGMLNAPLYSMEDDSAPRSPHTAAAVLPVYGQSVPQPALRFLQQLCCKNLFLVAAFGSMHAGAALTEAARAAAKCGIIGGAEIPVSHTYTGDSPAADTAALRQICERLQNPRPVTLPKRRKQLFARLMPAFFPKLAARIQKTDACTACGTCSARCPMKAMQSGVPQKNCMRCMRCVSVCPQRALRAVYHPILRFYLRKPRRTASRLFL